MLPLPVWPLSMCGSVQHDKASSNQAIQPLHGEGRTILFQHPFFDESMGGPMYKLPVWHPFRLVILFLFDIYLILVPYTYIKIFTFRINLRKNQKQDTSLKRRNIMSTGYNIAVWFVEALVTLMVSNFESILFVLNKLFVIKLLFNVYSF